MNKSFLENSNQKVNNAIAPWEHFMKVPCYEEQNENDSSNIN